MSKILLIFKNSILRNKLTLFLSIGTAVLMGLIFYGKINADGTVYASGTISVGVVDDDNSTLSEDLCKYLESSLGMEIISDDYDSLSALLIDRRLSAIIEVPAGFEGSAISGRPEKISITTLDDYENSAFIEAYLNSYIRGVSVIAQAADGSAQMFSEMLSSQSSPNTITLAETNSQVDQRVKTADAYILSVGFMLMMISGITVFISNQILVDRQLGTFSRMKCSSLRSSEYVIGISLFGVICCTLTNLIFNVFVYSVSGEMPVPFGVAFWVGELFMVFSVGLAMLFAMLVSDQRSLMTVGVGYAVIGSMLGGAWFPIDFGTGFVGNVAKIFPQYWLMDLLRKYTAEFNVLTNVCVLALWAVLVYLVSAVLFTRKNA
ncbi:MAG: ABC transporter permease [Oscillospiraceae bacterium]|nr:ABC transporter permease [Oscillospiraceae bacterium]